MTTHQLAALLLAQPNVIVYNYVQELEDYGETDKVKFYDDENQLPYAKTNPPDMPETGLVLIEGWCL